MSKEAKSLDLITKLVASVKYEKGEMIDAEESLDIADKLVQLGAYADWINFGMMLDCLNMELRSVNKIYDGNIPKNDQKEIAEKIHKNFKSVPLDYMFYFQLPDGLNIEKSIIINQYCKIEKITNDHVSAIDENNTHKYLRRPFSLKRLTVKLSGTGDTEDLGLATPNYTNLKEGSTYLVISTKGLVAQYSITTEDIDPIHIYKLLIAYLRIRGIIKSGGLYHALAVKSSVEYGKQAIVYRPDMEFIANYLRPIDESEYISQFIFDENITYKKLDQLLADFRQLIATMKNEYLELERNKIINSLYWYFEGEKTRSRPFRTLLQVSMFDAFFPKSDNRDDKIKAIVKIFNISEVEKNKFRDDLNEMYRRRHDIGHGNIQLLEVHRSDDQEIHRDNLPNHISGRYITFINDKIKRLLTM